MLDFLLIQQKEIFSVILLKNIKLFNGLLTICIIINIFSYAIGRLQLIPILVIGSIQILLCAFINIIGDKMKDFDE